MIITLKYIITDFGAVLFNEAVTHSQVAKGFKKVHSAGFVLLRSGIAIKVYGRSESLKLDSHPVEDKKVIDDILSTFSSIHYNMMDIEELYQSKK